VTVLDTEGHVLGDVIVTGVRALKRNDRTVVVKLRAPNAYAKRIAGIRVQQPWVCAALPDAVSRIADDEIVCRCERVTAGEIRALIRKGYRDVNEIKAVTRAGMGACGGKTCTSLIARLFRQEGVPPDAVTPNVKRPLFVEVPLGLFAGGNEAGSLDHVPGVGRQAPGVTDRRLRITDHTLYDVIVIGAGSVGVPAALALAEVGIRVLVLDRFASQGQGSNKAAIGGVRATHSDPAKIRLCLRSLAVFSAWQDVYGHDIEWTTGGYSFVAYRKQESRALKDLLAAQHTYGLDIAWYGRDALLTVVPGLNPEGLVGGTYSPGDGHCSPLLAGHAFYDAAKQAGATFHFGERVREILTTPETAGTGRRVTGVRTNRGCYCAPVVVNAAGAWAAEVGRMVGLHHPIVCEAHEAGVTEPVAHFLDPLLVDIRPAPGSRNCYFFQIRSGQVVFCITPEPAIERFDRRESSTFLPLVAPRLIDLMPRLANVRVRRTWRGIYPMTPDGVPIVGWARDVEGYLMAVGMCGQGFMLGPGLGELLARMVAQGNLSPDDREILDVLSPYRVFEGQEALR
jgi:sarcosine oxidase subunit beta